MLGLKWGFINSTQRTFRCFSNQISPQIIFFYPLLKKKKQALTFYRISSLLFWVGGGVGIYFLFLIKDANLLNHEIRNILI